MEGWGVKESRIDEDAISFFRCSGSLQYILGAILVCNKFDDDESKHDGWRLLL